MYNTSFSMSKWATCSCNQTLKARQPTIYEVIDLLGGAYYLSHAHFLILPNPPAGITDFCICLLLKEIRAEFIFFLPIILKEIRLIRILGKLGRNVGFCDQWGYRKLCSLRDIRNQSKMFGDNWWRGFH